MATSVHLPKQLLERVDARAQARGVSRNRLIIEALEQTLSQNETWSEEFLEEFATPAEADLKTAAADMMRAINAAKKSKQAPPF